MGVPSMRTLPRLMLAGSALMSCSIFASLPHDVFQPFALMASFLPLQLGALVWVRLSQSSLDRKPLASDQCLRAVHSEDVSGR